MYKEDFVNEDYGELNGKYLCTTKQVKLNNKRILKRNIRETTKENLNNI